MEEIITILKGYNEEKNTLTVCLLALKDSYSVNEAKRKHIIERIQQIDLIIKEIRNSLLTKK